MRTKKTNEGLILDENNKEAFSKFAEPAPGTNPMMEDFFPLAESANANVVATAKGRKMFFTLERLREMHDESGFVPAVGLLCLALIEGDEIPGLDPDCLSVSLVARDLSKEEAYAQVEG